MKYSIVIPCYNSGMTIRKVVALAMQELAGKDVEFILVNDASADEGKTIAQIAGLAGEYPNICAVDLAKNAGQHNAVLAGLNYARGDYIIGMDDDMQTHPSQMHCLLEEIEKGYDIVYAYYPEKKHGFLRNLGSRFNSWSVRVLIGKPKGLHTSSFWIIRKFVRDSVVQYRSPYAYMQGLFLRTTKNITCIPVEHFEREGGRSNYSFRSLVRLWSNIIGFSVVPLRLAGIIGSLFSAAGILGAAWILMRKLVFHSVVAGWTSIMTAVCFFSGLILLFMGLIGEYIGRMFLAGSGQPQYVVKNVIEIKEKK